MNAHLGFSLVKSGIRILGLLSLFYCVPLGIILLIFAEALGIFEEIV